MFKHCIWFTLTKINHVKTYETATRVVLMYTIHTCPRSSALIIQKILRRLSITSMNAMRDLIIFCFYAFLLGCGEKGPFNESSYDALGGALPPRFAALDTSNPRKSKVAWCRDMNQIGGFIEINLGTSH